VRATGARTGAAVRLLLAVLLALGGHAGVAQQPERVFFLVA
jgi:hypothetical protein